jgi:hypothetical protein
MLDRECPGAVLVHIETQTIMQSIVTPRMSVHLPCHLGGQSSLFLNVQHYSHSLHSPTDLRSLGCLVAHFVKVVARMVSDCFPSAWPVVIEVERALKPFVRASARTKLQVVGRH